MKLYLDVRRLFAPIHYVCIFKTFKRRFPELHREYQFIATMFRKFEFIYKIKF